MRRRDTIHADYEVKNEALALRKDNPEAVSSAFTPRKYTHTYTHTLAGFYLSVTSWRIRTTAFLVFFTLHTFVQRNWFNSHRFLPLGYTWTL